MTKLIVFLLLLGIITVYGRPLASTTSSNTKSDLSKKSNLTKTDANKRACPVSYFFYGVKTIADRTSPPSPNPLITLDDYDCESICSNSLYGAMAWTRQQSTDECYCIMQPFGDGYTTSAIVDSDWNTGWFPNEPGCTVIIYDQQLISNTLGNIHTSTDVNCYNSCASGNYKYWTWYAANFGKNCYCVGDQWGAGEGDTVIEYIPGWEFGIL